MIKRLTSWHVRSDISEEQALRHWLEDAATFMDMARLTAVWAHEHVFQP